MGLFGGIAGPLAEVWYFVDYWRPPSIFGIAVLSLEDVLVGFAIAALGSTLYAFLFSKYLKLTYQPQKKITIGLFITGTTLLIVGTSVLHINSVLASCAIFLLCSVVMCTLRPDLIPASASTAVALTLLIIPLYWFLFNYVSPGYFERYWLLGGKPYGIVIAHIPLTELLWYFTWGSFAAILYPFYKGKAFVSKANA
jgi:hypothetical protein